MNCRRSDRHINQVKIPTPARPLGSALAWLATEGSDSEYTDGMAADVVIKIMQGKKDEPFFLAVGFYRPHSPYIAPKKYFDMYPVDKVPLPKEIANDLDDIPEPALFTKPAHWGLSEPERKEALRAYYATISFMDAQVGKLLDKPDRLKLTEHTIVVLRRDHGYNE